MQLIILAIRCVFVCEYIPLHSDVKFFRFVINLSQILIRKLNIKKQIIKN